MKKVLITGATGMVGSKVLQLCLQNNEIGIVILLVRRPTGVVHEKLTEIIVHDFLHYEQFSSEFENIDIVYYCLGAYTGTVDSKLFRNITFDYPVNLAKSIVAKSPDSIFCLLSGQGADRNEKSKLQFARDKGAAENALSTMSFKAFYAIRPGYIYPIIPRREPNFGYTISRYLYPILKLLGDNLSITDQQLANAMFKIGMNGFPKEIIENKELRKI